MSLKALMIRLLGSKGDVVMQASTSARIDARRDGSRKMYEVSQKEEGIALVSAPVRIVSSAAQITCGHAIHLLTCPARSSPSSHLLDQTSHAADTSF